MAFTGNNSISDGDYIQLQIPIINDGDYSWNGSKPNSGQRNNHGYINIRIITIPGMETKVIYFNSTIQAYEGALSVS